MIPIIGLVSNGIRGGQFGLPAGNWINAGIFGVVATFVTGSPFLGLLCVPAMFLGSAPGWKDYIGALGGWEDRDLTGNRYIDKLLSPLLGNPRLWGFAGLFLRGLFWGACLALPFACFGHYGTAGWFLLCGSAMPVCYWAALKWAKNAAAKYTSAWDSIGWSAAELLYGAVLWSAL